MIAIGKSCARLGVIGTFALLAAVGPAAAIPVAVVEYVETDLGAGQFQYDFTVANSELTAGFSIYDVFLQFSAGVVSVTVPTDWAEINDGATFIDAFSTMPAADIGPGQSLAGFRYVFSQAIGDTAFSVYFANPDDELNPILYAGVTSHATDPSVPPQIPEPASLALLAGGLGLLVARRLSR